MSAIFDEIIENTRLALNALLVRDGVDEKVLSKTHRVLLMLSRACDNIETESPNNTEPEWLVHAALDVGLARKRKKRTQKILD